MKRAIVHASTFSENSFAMRAGLATLDVLEHEQLGTRTTHMGDELQRRLMERAVFFRNGESRSRYGTASHDALDQDVSAQDNGPGY